MKLSEAKSEVLNSVYTLCMGIKWNDRIIIKKKKISYSWKKKNVANSKVKSMMHSLMNILIFWKTLKSAHG